MILFAPSQNRALLAAVVEYAQAADKDDRAACTLSLTTDSASIVILLFNSPVQRPDVFSMFYRIPSSGALINSTIGSWSDAYAGVSSFISLTPAR